MRQSTYIFMSNLDENSVRWALQMLLGLTCLCVLLVTLLVAVTIVFRPKTGTGCFCGRCGGPLPKDPAQAIALADKTYVVYNCPKCKGETILSQ
jgi:hypothetical protein